MGALPGGLVGGFLAGFVSPLVLKTLLGVMTLIAIAKAVGFVRFHVPRAVLGPAGFVVGVMTGTSGGAGILFSPILLSSGLTGASYVATISLVAAVTLRARGGLRNLGLITRELVLPILVIGGTIFVGNSVGERLRRRISDRGTTWLEYGTLVVCVTLSIFGVRPESPEEPESPESLESLESPEKKHDGPDDMAPYVEMRVEQSWILRARGRETARLDQGRDPRSFELDDPRRPAHPGPQARGQTLNNKWTIDRLVDVGGMAAV